MRPIDLLLLLTALLSGCASHFQCVRNNEVTLVLRRPEAVRVMLATSLDGFRLRPAAPVSGDWRLTLPAEKSFRYFYQVDGTVFVPDCKLREKDDFGSENCIFEP